MRSRSLLCLQLGFYSRNPAVGHIEFHFVSLERAQSVTEEDVKVLSKLLDAELKAKSPAVKTLDEAQGEVQKLTELLCLHFWDKLQKVDAREPNAAAAPR